jgi:hypothetical protein
MFQRICPCRALERRNIRCHLTKMTSAAAAHASAVCTQTRSCIHLKLKLKKHPYYYRRKDKPILTFKIDASGQTYLQWNHNGRVDEEHKRHSSHSCRLHSRQGFVGRLEGMQPKGWKRALAVDLEAVVILRHLCWRLEVYRQPAAQTWWGSEHIGSSPLTLATGSITHERFGDNRMNLLLAAIQLNLAAYFALSC